MICQVLYLLQLFLLLFYFSLCHGPGLLKLLNFLFQLMVGRLRFAMLRGIVLLVLRFLPEPLDTDLGGM